jgi:hypothetical protein
MRPDLTEPRGSEEQKPDDTFSMPKLGVPRTKTVQPRFANLLCFRGFLRALL